MKTQKQPAAHTPGPWEIDALLTPDNCYVYILRDTQGGESEAEAVANACLIAAAPELLTAAKRAFANSCKRAVSRAVWRNSDQVAHEALKAAIAKAEGRE